MKLFEFESDHGGSRWECSRFSYGGIVFHAYNCGGSHFELNLGSEHLYTSLATIAFDPDLVDRSLHPSGEIRYVPSYECCGLLLKNYLIQGL